MYVNTSVESESLLKNERLKRLNIYKFVGYTDLILNFKYSPKKQFNLGFSSLIEESPLNLYGKIKIYPKTQGDLKTALKSLNQYKEFLICVESKDKEGIWTQ